MALHILGRTSQTEYKLTQKLKGPRGAVDFDTKENRVFCSIVGIIIRL